MQKNGEVTHAGIQIRIAGYDDIDDMKRVLARAYDKEPAVNWFVLQERKRTQRTEMLFKIIIKNFAMKYDQVFTTKELNAVDVWSPPEPEDSWKISTLKGLSLIPKWIYIYGFRAFPSRASGSQMLEEHHLKKPHYYLFAVGVDPDYQGKGIGSHLVQHGLRMCDKKRVPAYLECASERHVNFYQRHGFGVSEELVLPKGPKIWTMVYEPK